MFKWGIAMIANGSTFHLIHPLTTVLMQLPISAGAVSSAGTDVDRGSLKTTGNRVLDIMCLTWDE